MLLPVFVYATLRDKHERERALGRPIPWGRPATLADHQETLLRRGKGRGPGAWWPTVRPVAGSSVEGELLDLPAEDLHKLDAWEDAYTRKRVQTSKGPAWVYILKEAMK